jgi:hypothetical protein
MSIGVEIGVVTAEKGGTYFYLQRIVEVYQPRRANIMLDEFKLQSRQPHRADVLLNEVEAYLKAASRRGCIVH